MRDLNNCVAWKFHRLVPHQHMFDDYVDFALLRHQTGQPNAVAAPPQWIELPEGAPAEPTFRLHAEEVQELMDMLWSVGFRPTQAKASAGLADALQHHLADMRAIAFSKLEIEKP